MFTTFIVQPIFNLLVLIFTLLPAHNFGLALIIFTVIIRLLMWPLVKKQIYNAKAMRELQPELKRIKKAANGDRQKESMMVMEMYKERDINPFGSIGILLLQLPILIGLYSGINKIVRDPNAIHEFAYSFLQSTSWLKELASDISRFDQTLLGFVDLTRSALDKTGGIYWPAMLLVIGSAVVQYYQSKQLMPNDKDARKLREIFKSAGEGQKADQAEMNAAIGRSTRFLIPTMIFFFTVNIASALSLYLFVSSLVAIIQQDRALKMEEKVALKSPLKVTKQTKKEPIEAEIVTKKPKNTKKSASKNKKSKRRK